MNLLVPASIVGVVALVVFLLYLLLRGIAALADRLMGPAEEPLLADDLEELLEAARPPASLGERIDRAFERLVGRSSLALSSGQAAAILLLATTAAGVAAYVWQPREGLALGAAAGAALLTLLYFVVMHRRWKQSVQDQLPDTFHLLARSLRAGLTVDQSVELIAVQGPQPLAAELKRCGDNLKLGMPLTTALEMAARRVELPDFDLFVGLLGVQRETGGNLALLVDRLAATVRSRNHFRGHAAAVTAMGRLTGLVLATAPFVMLGFYWLTYPDYLTRLTTTTAGLTALMVALALELIGVLWMWRLLKIEY